MQKKYFIIFCYVSLFEFITLIPVSWFVPEQMYETGEGGKKKFDAINGRLITEILFWGWNRETVVDIGVKMG